METTYRLNAQELTPRFLKALKTLFSNQEVEITVRSVSPFPDVEQAEWLRAASSNPAFDFLNEAAEDIYTLMDGRPVDDEK